MQLNTNVIVSILGLLGLIIAFVSGLLTSRAQSHQESEKWVRAREDDVRRDIRLAIADVAEKLAAFAHSMMWTTYRVNRTNANLKEIVDTYGKESHELIGRLVSSQIRLAALDMNAYQKVTPFISNAINLSEEVDRAISLFQQDSRESREAVRECNHKALAFIKELPEQMGNTIGLESFGELHREA
jgi:hypothetical protein